MVFQWFQVVSIVGLSGFEPTKLVPFWGWSWFHPTVGSVAFKGSMNRTPTNKHHQSHLDIS